METSHIYIIHKNKIKKLIDELIKSGKLEVDKRGMILKKGMLSLFGAQDIAMTKATFLVHTNLIQNQLMMPMTTRVGWMGD